MTASIPPYSLSVLDLDNRPTPTIVVGGRHYDLMKLAPQLVRDPTRGLLDILEAWEQANGELDSLATQIGSAAASGALISGIGNGYAKLISAPSKMVFAGLNYHDHLIDDLKITDFDKSATDPLFFLKHAGALEPAGAAIDYPQQTKKLDWEIELVAIFGRAGRHISRDAATSYIAGYAVGLDLSARDWQMSPRHMRNFDLFGGKAFDSSSPVGPYLVPAQFVEPTKLALRLSVNGDVKQSSNSSNMIWSIAELVEAVSRHMRLLPGDMLFTGSPAGVGLVRDTYLKPGDHIAASISGLGQLSVSIR